MQYYVFFFIQTEREPKSLLVVRDERESSVNNQTPSLTEDVDISVLLRCRKMHIRALTFENYDCNMHFSQV